MKKCSTCRRELEISNFSKRGNGLQSNCKECNRAYYQNYYKSNPSEKNRLAKRRKLVREEIKEYIRKVKDVPCADCKIKYPFYVMQFDHIRDKEFNISTAINFHTLNKIKLEIAKCEIVCANCHAERTFQRIQTGVGSAGMAR